MVDGLTETGAIRKYGGAPPGYLENQMQEWLEVFLGDREDMEELILSELSALASKFVAASRPS